MFHIDQELMNELKHKIEWKDIKNEIYENVQLNYEDEHDLVIQQQLKVHHARIVHNMNQIDCKSKDAGTFMKAGEQAMKLRCVMKRSSDNCICVICHENIKKNQMCANLFCKHQFHIKCIKKWEQQQMKIDPEDFMYATCPICRHNYEPPDIHHDSDDDHDSDDVYYDRYITLDYFTYPVD